MILNLGKLLCAISGHVIYNHCHLKSCHLQIRSFIDMTFTWCYFWSGHFQQKKICTIFPWLVIADISEYLASSLSLLAEHPSLRASFCLFPDCNFKMKSFKLKLLAFLSSAPSATKCFQKLTLGSLLGSIYSIFD